MQYKNYLLSVLVIMGAVSVLDRFVFALALEPIKQDLGLSDSQLGLMTGIAFAAFYAVAGIPIARWADRGNRVTLATVTTTLLGLTVMLCGVVSNFFQLLLARAGVAIGEAGAMPTAQSMLADYFGRAERPKVMAIFAMFYPIGMVLGYLLGGWLIEDYGWRMTFVLLGLPGLLVALLIKKTLKEPRGSDKQLATAQPPDFVSVLNILWHKTTFRQMLLAFCVLYFFAMGTSQWLATFFIRSHNMGSAELGVWLAGIWGVFGLLGNYLGGVLATRFAAKKEKLHMRGLSIVVILSGLSNAATYLAPSQSMALLFLAISAILLTMPNGPIFSAVQCLVEERLRSVTLALLLLFANLIGFGLGPLAIGLLSDFLAPTYGDESLRYALAFSTPGVVWIAFHFWRAGETIEDDIKQVGVSEL